MEAKKLLIFNHCVVKFKYIEMLCLKTKSVYNSFIKNVYLIYELNRAQL
jgi:hypothetical protein